MSETMSYCYECSNCFLEQFLLQYCINILLLEGNHCIPSCVTERGIQQFVVNILFSRSNGHFEIVKILVEDYKCEVNAEDNGGETPLHKACW